MKIPQFVFIYLLSRNIFTNITFKTVTYFPTTAARVIMVHRHLKVSTIVTCKKPNDSNMTFSLNTVCTVT